MRHISPQVAAQSAANATTDLATAITQHGPGSAQATQAGQHVTQAIQDAHDSGATDDMIRNAITRQ